MRGPAPALALALALAVLAAGCAARGARPDPYAYTRVPFYADSFDLGALPADGAVKHFRVEDGSLATIHVRVWVNATQGVGTIRLENAAGQVAFGADRTSDAVVTSDLGTWTVHVSPVVSPEGPAAGTVQILVTRA